MVNKTCNDKVFGDAGLMLEADFLPLHDGRLARLDYALDSEKDKEKEGGASRGKLRNMQRQNSLWVMQA
jgi:hypothetical protein